MKIEVHTSTKTYPVIVERGILQRAAEVIGRQGHVYLISDSGVPLQWRNMLQAQYPDAHMYVFAHGEKESVDTAATKFAMILGHKPTAILLGHRHSNGFSTSYDCKVVQSGTGAGTDRYAIDHRLHNAPEQMAFLCGENGITCYYDIKLNK